MMTNSPAFSQWHFVMTLNEELNKITSIFLLFACPVGIRSYRYKKIIVITMTHFFLSTCLNIYLSLPVQNRSEFLRWKAHMTHNLLKPTRTYVAWYQPVMLFIGFNLNSHNGIINTIFKLYFLHAEAKLKLKLRCECGIFSVRRLLYSRRFQYLSINGGQTSVLTFWLLWK